jgi:hypothetical protein
MEDDGLETHLWIGNHSRQIKIDGEPIVLYRCPLCTRDFSREPGKPNWRAIYVSTFRIAFLPDAVSQKWLSEPCPGRPQQSSEELPVLPAAEPMVKSVTAEPDVIPRRVPGVARRRPAVRVRGSI